MDWYTAVKDFAGPLATLVAAAAAVLFARRQAKTAQLQAAIALDKLKFDTMTDRLDVVSAAEEIISLALNADPKKQPPYNEMTSRALRIRRGYLYFTAETNAYLDGIINSAHAVGDADLMATSHHATREEEIAKHRYAVETRRDANRELGRIMTRMAPELALTLLARPQAKTKPKLKRKVRFFRWRARPDLDLAA